MNCEACQSQLLEYLDEALPENERGMLESHLETCPACMAALASERKAMAEFPALLAPGLQPRKLSSAARNRLVFMGRTAEPRRTMSSGRWLQWRRPLTAAAAILILAGGIGIHRYALNRPGEMSGGLQGSRAHYETPIGTNALNLLIAAICMSNAQARSATALNQVCRISM